MHSLVCEASPVEVNTAYERALQYSKARTEAEISGSEEETVEAYGRENMRISHARRQVCPHHLHLWVALCTVGGQQVGLVRANVAGVALVAPALRCSLHALACSPATDCCCIAAQQRAVCRLQGRRNLCRELQCMHGSLHLIMCGSHVAVQFASC